MENNIVINVVTADNGSFDCSAPGLYVFKGDHECEASITVTGTGKNVYLDFRDYTGKYSILSDLNSVVTDKLVTFTKKEVPKVAEGGRKTPFKETEVKNKPITL